MTGRLKVYDADTATWKYVDSAGEAVTLLQYVPLSPNVPMSTMGMTTSYTANTGIVHSPAITAIPPEAVAISLQFFARHTVVTASHRVNIFAYDAALGGANLRAQLITGKVASHYEALTVHYVELGGNRQYDWEVQIGAAGTTTTDAYVTGYWLKVPSAAVGMGGGNTVGKGTAFPLAPAVNDHFVRTDLGNMEFFWNGTYWLSVQLFDQVLGGEAAAADASIAATTSLKFPRLLIAADAYIVDFIVSAFILTGGTALAAGHKWNGQLEKRTQANATVNIGGTANIDSGASNEWKLVPVSINALLNGASPAFAMSVTWTRTGTPGNIFPYSHVTYRLVAT